MRTITANSERETMEKKRLIVGFAWIVAGLFASAQAQAQIIQPIKTITNTYAAKFICGVQSQTDITSDPDAQGGRYSTKINIHNNTGVQINFRKKFIWLHGSASETFELPTDPLFKVNESLKEDQAMEVVCRDIYKYLNISNVPPGPWRYIEGFVIVEVFNLGHTPSAPPDPLDVVGVYTYKGDLPGAANANASGVSIDVVVYPAKSNRHILH